MFQALKLSKAMQYKISVLVFVQNSDGKLLMLQRNKAPNKGLWSPIGGKLDMQSGESPHECATRETREEIGLNVKCSQMHLFCMISEKAYEGSGHWLMFLFSCSKPIEKLPSPIDEGQFSFFTRQEIDSLEIPETDRHCLWNIYDKHRYGFVAVRADCSPGKPLDIVYEQVIGPDSPSAQQCAPEIRTAH